MNIRVWALVCPLTLAGVSFCHAQAGGTEHEAMAAKHATPSTTLIITIEGKSTTLAEAELKSMPQKTLTARNGHSSVDETYTGVPVADLLAKLGFIYSSVTAKRVYHSYLRAEGTDGYWVLYSASELEPVLRETGSLIALTVDGKPLGGEGAFKIVIAGERRPARWVRNLKSLTVVTVP